MDECTRESVNPLGARITNPENPHRCRTGRCFYAHPSQTRYLRGLVVGFPQSGLRVDGRYCRLGAGAARLALALRCCRCCTNAAASARSGSLKGRAGFSVVSQHALIIGAACDDPASASGRFGTKPRRRAARVFARGRTSAIVDGWVGLSACSVCNRTGACWAGGDIADAIIRRVGARRTDSDALPRLRD